MVGSPIRKEVSDSRMRVLRLDEETALGIVVFVVLTPLNGGLKVGESGINRTDFFARFGSHHDPVWGGAHFFAPWQPQ